MVAPDMTDQWLTTTTLPTSPTPADLREFFGCPPAPESELPDLIARKRRHWHNLAASSPAGRAKAKTVKTLIQQAADALMRGTDIHAAKPDLGRDAPTPASYARTDRDEVRSLDDLWRTLEEMLFSQKSQDALNLAAQARSYWAEEPRAHWAFAWVVGVITQTQAVHADLVQQAHQSIQRALAATPAEPLIWATDARLLIYERQYDDSLAVLARAEQACGKLDSRLLTIRAETRFALGDVLDGLADSAGAVHAAEGDEAVRSQVVETILHDAVARCLPLSSDKALKSYRQAIDVAAWCAVGAPEAEDLVRPHRLWAERASQRVYAGGWASRSLVAVLTLFVALPLYNRMKSKAVWRVLLDGPVDGNPMWKFVANPVFVRDAHRDANGRIPWASPDGTWPVGTAAIPV